MEQVIGKYMVKSPYVAEPDNSLFDAQSVMSDCGIRHLPILDEGKLVGLLSERDLRAAMSLPQAAMLTVSDVMKRDVFVAKRTEPLRDLVRTMQERKLGSTVVVNDSEDVVGIFTVTDALGMLADLLEQEEDSEDPNLHAYRKSVPDLVGLATTQANKAREKSESGS